ncbi:MAG: hypothetical protein KKF41_00345 [Actinobacteria bacterium]|nr:hypothetical protein [Actinomycetota bacterium]MBU1942695.1 hypothetical protein [Actinomycetota bacterium]MBU2686017.1 hypothetical protein [Actinomycetota bacterium]
MGHGIRQGGCRREPRLLMAAPAAFIIAATLFAAGCGGTVRSTQGTGAVSSTPASSTSAGTVEVGPLMLGVIVHLEGYRNEARNQAVFAEHATMVRGYADIFERYGLRLTLEASPEFVEGCARWGDNVLAEMAGRGHGIGVHADLGAEPVLSQERFVEGLTEMNRDIEALGVQVRHVSGVCSSLDWVAAARGAGFEFVTGTVEYALKSIPADRLPAEYRYIAGLNTPSQAHGNVPADLADRLHPWRMVSGDSWLWDDPAGEVVILPGDGGTCITRMAEDAGAKASGGKAIFDSQDVAAFTAQLDRALECCTPEALNVYYVGWSIGAKARTEAVEEWAQAMKTYVDAGKVQWKTLPQMYDAYVGT